MVRAFIEFAESKPSRAGTSGGASNFYPTLIHRGDVDEIRVDNHSRGGSCYACFG
jgi:hypothetical protein